MNKKPINIEELTKQTEDAKKTFEALNEQLTKAKQEEADRRKAQLALEKETRKKEVEEAFDKYNQLLQDYIRDYGSYSTTRGSHDGWWLNPVFRIWG